MRRMTLRTALRTNVIGRPPRATTRSPVQRLPGVRPRRDLEERRRSRRRSRRDDREDRAAPTPPPAPSRKTSATTATARALDHEVEERGDEARAHPGERQLDVDAFRRRDPDRSSYSIGGEATTVSWASANARLDGARGARCARRRRKPERLGADGAAPPRRALPRGRGRPRARAPGASRTTRSTRRLEQLVSTRAQPRLRRRRPRRSLGALLLDAATGGGCASGRGLLARARCCCSAPWCSPAVWAIDDPAAAIGVVPGAVPGRGRAGQRRAATSARGDQAALSSQIFTQQHPR